MRARLLIAILFAAGSMISGYLYLRGLTAELTGGRKVAVLVAAQELAAGTRIARDHVGVRDIPEGYLQPDAIVAGSADEARVIGRALGTKLAQGQQLTWSHFEGQHVASRRLAYDVARRQRAVTVPIDLSGSFAGMLRPGDHVDVIGTFQRGSNESTTATLLQNVVVLAIGDQRAGEVEAATAAAGAPAVVPRAAANSVTLAVDLDEAELLLFAHNRGTLGFALRGEGDFETVTDIGEKSFSDVLDERRRQSEYQRRGARKPPMNAELAPSALGGAP